MIFRNDVGINISLFTGGKTDDGRREWPTSVSRLRSSVQLSKEIATIAIEDNRGIKN